MRALLILNKNKSKDFRVIVRLEEKGLKERVNSLINEAKIAEAFSLIIAKAQVETYIPPGSKLTQRPDFTFIEDML